MSALSLSLSLSLSLAPSVSLLARASVLSLSEHSVTGAAAPGLTLVCALASRLSALLHHTRLSGVPSTVAYTLENDAHEQIQGSQEFYRSVLHLYSPCIVSLGLLVLMSCVLSMLACSEGKT